MLGVNQLALLSALHLGPEEARDHRPVTARVKFVETFLSLGPTGLLVGRT